MTRQKQKHRLSLRTMKTLSFATLGYNDVPVVDEDGVTLSPKNAEIVLGTDQEYTIVKAAPTATAKAGSARAAATMEDLQALLEQANGIDTSIYTESSVAILNAAINRARQKRLSTAPIIC